MLLSSEFGPAGLISVNEEAAKTGEIDMICTARQYPREMPNQDVDLEIRWSVTAYLWKTCPCNGYPLIPHFHKVKLGYVGV